MFTRWIIDNETISFLGRASLGTETMKRQAASQEIREVLARLHAEGTYPSQYRVVAALSAPYFMGHEEGRAVYREVKRKLGISV